MTRPRSRESTSPRGEPRTAECCPTTSWHRLTRPGTQSGSALLQQVPDGWEGLDAVTYCGGGNGACVKSKQSSIPSDVFVRALSAGRPKLFSQNLIRLTCECSALQM